jgi:hypothetical protein
LHLREKLTHLNWKRFTSYFEANYDLNDECHTADAVVEIKATRKLIEQMGHEFFKITKTKSRTTTLGM